MNIVEMNWATVVPAAIIRADFFAVDVGERFVGVVTQSVRLACIPLTHWNKRSSSPND